MLLNRVVNATNNVRAMRTMATAATTTTTLGGKNNYITDGRFRAEAPIVATVMKQHLSFCHNHPFNNRNNFSSHSDFSPQKKHTLSENSHDGDEEKEILSLIDTHVKSNPIMLYMKGSPSQPQCGFSATVVQILKSSGVDFASVNVLDYPQVREGVKKYAQWPTIPQLYVSGEFIGGCDVVREMDASGELQELLKMATDKKKEKKSLDGEEK